MTRHGGEVVFNTSLTGYQEVFTDPSYAGQIVCLTYPHIGNVGTNLDDEESTLPHIEALVVKEFSAISSNWRSGESAQAYLTRHNIPVVWDIDTRSLVRHIRKMGALRGVVATDGTPADHLIAEARALPSMAGLELASRVTVDKEYAWDRGSIELTASPWHEAMGEAQSEGDAKQLRVVAYDYGIKQNILRILVDHNCEVVVVPAQTSAEDAIALKPDGIFLSNGPGDPEPATYAIETIRNLLGRVPVFGICLGHQLCGLALGGKTFKLRFGHHGSNHPVKNLLTGQVEITAQNHGFCVDPDSLPSDQVEITHMNLNDQTNEGLRHRTLPLFSVQYHPEASPGPHDSHYLFRQFTETMKHWKLSGALRRGQARA
jgi:carbamoyl-phosphate synthase small subunit